MSKPKYKKGRLIETIGEYDRLVTDGKDFFKVEYSKLYCKTYHHSFIDSWQYRMLNNLIKAGKVFVADSVESEGEE